MFMDASCMHLEAIALFEYFLILKLGGLKHNTYSSFMFGSLLLPRLFATLSNRENHLQRKHNHSNDSLIECDE